MRFIVRTVSLLAAFLVPVLVAAQISVTQTVPGVSSQSSQIFSGGIFGMPFGGGFGGGGYGISGIAITIINVINGVLVPLLFAVSFIVFLYGIARAYIFSGGDSTKVAEGHRLILWGIIGFVVMLSVWGLVNILSDTFGLDSGIRPTYPTI